MARRTTAFLAVLLCTVLFVSAAAPTPGPTQAELSSAAANAADWLHPNHDYGGQRFVALDEINRSNVHRLSPVCHFQAGGTRPFHTHPIVYRGVMYVTTTYSTIALDAATCSVRWRHDWQPKAQENWPQQRGVALKEGKVVRGTRDGYLFALDAETGQVLWEQGAADAAKGETFTMPPLIYEDLVLIGPAGNEAVVQGWVGAFRLDAGAPVWRFNTFPGRDEPGAETWNATEALTAGGAVWTPFSLTWLSPREPLRDSGGFLPQSQPLRSSPCPRSRTRWDIDGLAGQGAYNVGKEHCTTGGQDNGVQDHLR
jgi:alcohol dehydrogenase (cytochrome c)